MLRSLAHENGKINEECSKDLSSEGIKGAFESLADRPPMTILVVGGSPASGGTFTSSQMRTRTGSFDRAVPITSSSLAFKLMPRSGVAGLCTPSPASLERSRKRRAHSISVHPESPFSGTAEDAKSPSVGKQDYESSPGLSPVEHQLSMMCGLSLRSPIPVRVLKDDDDDLQSPPKVSNQHICRPMASSFSVYNSSPVGSIQRTDSGSLSGSIGSMVPAGRTPSSSAKSSPRHVPLTILSSQKGPSPMRLSMTGRPPFHAGFSKMLQSLDGTEDSDDLASPRARVSCSVMHPSFYTPSAVDASSDSSVGIGTPRTNQCEESFATATPKTPLPRVTLTPRTPMSGPRTKSLTLPVFPSASSDGFSFSPSPRSENEVGLLMDSLLEGFPAPPPSAEDGNKPSFPAPRRPFHYMLNPEPSNSPTPANFLCTVNTGTPPTITTTAGSSGQNRLVHEVFSVMNPSSNGGFMTEIMKADARAGVREAEEGSLSDSDDEEFVLGLPCKTDESTSQCRDDNRRVKRSRGSLLDLQRQSSFTTLTSNQISSTSLFGMDIVQEEGPPNSRSMTPFPRMTKRKSFNSSNSLRKDNEGAGLRRGESEISLGSLGLYLDEASCEPGRDLRTPPISIQRPISPPPLAKRSFNGVLSTGGLHTHSYASDVDTGCLGIVIYK